MFSGAKYNRDLDVKEIAKLVRKDIAAEIKAGTLAEVKCSVRIERFSMGRSIDISVVEVPDWMQIWDREFVRFDVEHKSMAFYEGERYTPAAKATLRALERILQSYNRDDSDCMVDHFDVHFYGHAEFYHKATHRDRELAEREVRGS